LQWLAIAGMALAGCTTGKDTLSKPQPERAAEINLELGNDYLRKGNLAGAKEKLDRAVDQNPRNAKAQSASGLLYDRLGDADKADYHYSRAVALDPSNPDISNNYAVFLCSKNRYERGEKFALEAGANPLYKTPEYAFFNAGNCARGAGDEKRAEAHYRHALELRPRFGAALYELADVEFRQANYLPARAFLERYSAAARMNAASLWLGVRIEKKLGNATAAKNYAQRLKSEYPAAAETKELLESERTGG
jgi:type IV pilus assembly protein PilF